jgi:hypothetical protein
MQRNALPLIRAAVEPVPDGVVEAQRAVAGEKQDGGRGELLADRGQLISHFRSIGHDEIVALSHQNLGPDHAATLFGGATTGWAMIRASERWATHRRIVRAATPTASTSRSSRDLEG